MIKVSIILPVLNEERNIEKCINNILLQTFQDWELIIINDGSTDNTVNLIKSFLKADKRISLINNSDHKGIIYCLNQGWRNANSNFICRVDADDTSHKDRIKKQYNFMIENPDIDLCGTSVTFILDENKNIKFDFYPPETHEEISNIIYKKNPFVHSSIMMKKNFLIMQNGYKNIGFKNIEDYYLWIRGHKNSKFYNLKECLINISLKSTPSWKEIFNRTCGHIIILYHEKKLISEMISVMYNFISMIALKFKIIKPYK